MTTRGFAGGLAEGLNQGMQMYAMSEAIKSRKAQDERAAAADTRDQEVHNLRMQDAANSRAMTEEWAGLLGWKPEMAAGSPVRPDAPSFAAPQQQQTPSTSLKLAGPLPQGGLAMNAPAPAAAPYAQDNPMPGLQQQQQQQQQQQNPVTADEFIQRQVLQGGAFANPQVLNKMAAIALKYNQSDKGIAFLNQAYTAHEKGLPVAMSKLMEGDPRGATEVLRGRGINIEGELTPVADKPNTWKATVDGKEREFNLRDMAMAANPMESFKMQADAQERQRKADLDQKEYDLKVRKQDMEEKESTAKIGTEKAKQARFYSQATQRGGDEPSSKTMKAIEKDRGRQFDLASMVPDEVTGKKTVDPQRRQALDRAAYAQQGIVEDALQRKLSAAEHQEFTDAMLDYPLDAVQKGDKAAVQKWQGEFMSRMGIDPAEEEAGKAAGDAGSLGKLAGKQPAPKGEAPPALKAAKEPTPEEKELEAVRFDAGDRQEMRKLQVERTASNLSPQERAENTRKIDALLAKHAPKGGLGGGYGKRPDGTEKGSGFLGVQKTRSGRDMTEYSVGLKINGKQRDVPTLVPGLSKKEIEYLKTEPDLNKRTPMNDSIIKKAEAHAKKRLSEGKSVFADEDKG